MKQIHGGDVYRNPNVVDFSANIHPHGTPENVIKAAAEALTKISNYPDIYCSRLTEAVAEFEQVNERDLIFGNGAAEVIFSLVLAKKPKQALIPVPTFLEYEQALAAVGAQIRHVQLERAQDYRLTEAVLGELTPDLDMVFLCNPNNPTGQMVEADLLHKIVEKCLENQILLVVDECFLCFTDEGDAASLKPYQKNNPQLFLLKAFTKMYGMAGIRLGYGICTDQELLERMRQVTQPWNVSIPAQAAGIAALKETEHVKTGLQIIQEERVYLVKSLRELGFRVYDPQANYIFFEGPEDLYERALAGGYLIRDCSNYPGLRKGMYRIAVKTANENRGLITWLKQL